MGDRFIGIDPGAHGAIAFLETSDAANAYPNGALVIRDMPTYKVKRNGRMVLRVDPTGLADILSGLDLWEHYVVIEQVSARPGQGVSSMFAFGRALGIVEGVLAGKHTPFSFVTPQKWQRHVGLARGGGKTASRDLAAKLFPARADLFNRVKDDGRADAALIAWWAAQRAQVGLL